MSLIIFHNLCSWKQSIRKTRSLMSQIGTQFWPTFWYFRPIFFQNKKKSMTGNCLYYFFNQFRFGLYWRDLGFVYVLVKKQISFLQPLKIPVFWNDPILHQWQREQGIEGTYYFSVCSNGPSNLLISHW